MKTKIFLSILMILINGITRSASIPEPYASIIDLPVDMQGWFSNENKKNLESLIKIYKPKTIIELGTWLGTSAIFMASIMPEDCKLYCIDDWTADSDVAILNTPGLDVKIKILYQQFLSNVKHHGLCHKIVPMRMKTLEAARSLNIKADLIYVDASHDENSVYADVTSWLPHLKKGGIMCGDDWNHFGISAAVNRVSSELGKKLKVDGNFWWFEPEL